MDPQAQRHPIRLLDRRVEGCRVALEVHDVRAGQTRRGHALQVAGEALGDVGQRFDRHESLDQVDRLVLLQHPGRGALGIHRDARARGERARTVDARPGERRGAGEGGVGVEHPQQHEGAVDRGAQRGGGDRGALPHIVGEPPTEHPRTRCGLAAGARQDRPELAESADTLQVEPARHPRTENGVRVGVDEAGEDDAGQMHGACSPAAPLGGVTTVADRDDPPVRDGQSLAGRAMERVGDDDEVGRGHCSGPPMPA
ncbi:hypothetical protein HMPREF1529_01169 [Microbacterium sp. oral taxon 186 str. F0373]|nr:hypothetical protein [Microbacterium sp. oral taxon 186]EPD84566.1 hypothetical protein HMPREF1529_01169 [Microbacterium sp. oral taxon 186 str. F0373]